MVLSFGPLVNDQGLLLRGSWLCELSSKWDQLALGYEAGVHGLCRLSFPLWAPLGATFLLRGFILDPLHLPLSFGVRREVEGPKGHHTDTRGRLIGPR